MAKIVNLACATAPLFKYRRERKEGAKHAKEKAKKVKITFLISLFISLYGCRSSFNTFYSSDVFIVGDEITIIFKEEKNKSSFSLNPHGGRLWTAWSKLYTAKYNFKIDQITNEKSINPYLVELIEQKYGDIKPYKYLLTKNGYTDKTGVRSENRKFVIVSDDKKFYNTETGKVIKDLGNDPLYKDFANIIKVKYEEIYKQHSKYGQVSTIFTSMNNGKYIVTYARDVSSYDFIDFHTINIFNVETSEITKFNIEVPESKSDGFRINDIEFINGQWICLISYFENRDSKMAIWYSENNIQELPYFFYESYDIWNVEKKYFAKLMSGTTDYNNRDYELKIYKYDSPEPKIIRLAMAVDNK